MTQTAERTGTDAPPAARPMKVWGASADTSGCWHYRIRLPLFQLEKRGHTVGWGTGASPDIDRDADVIIGQRVCNETISEWWQTWARRRRARLVFEIDDDLWQVPSENPQAHKLFSDPVVRDRLRRNAEAADAVFVSTEPLAKILGEYNDHVYVLPNCVPEGLVAMRDAWTPRFDSKVIVGWAGSPSHAVDFAAMPQALFRALDEDQRVTVVHTVGPDFFTPHGVRPGKVVRTPWLDDLVDYYRALNFDICVIPLADLPFNTAKSSVKFLEMAALGIPVIASAVGPYAEAIEHGRTGFLADSNRDWTRYLDKLLGSARLRRTIGENARAYARTRTIEGNAWRWEQALAEVLAA